ncbi:hypothetical protein SAMN02745226_00484 [Fervidobacterium gondwanense DSM 13020]|uniref:Uncharacterized protein n=1 Tax=Fervidobacterium gondwanense DSM 13020 TaxID=1121883 RepID=A0A1M7S557_FERGO|nr:hypothetical protein SAMN02745226_00484 [Fervidobacterium gondwanense DSM 13020]
MFLRLFLTHHVFKYFVTQLFGVIIIKSTDNLTQKMVYSLQRTPYPP